MASPAHSIISKLSSHYGLDLDNDLSRVWHQLGNPFIVDYLVHNKKINKIDRVQFTEKEINVILKTANLKEVNMFRFTPLNNYLTTRATAKNFILNQKQLNYLISHSDLSHIGIEGPLFFAYVMNYDLNKTELTPTQLQKIFKASIRNNNYFTELGALCASRNFFDNFMSLQSKINPLSNDLLLKDYQLIKNTVKLNNLPPYFVEFFLSLLDKRKIKHAVHSPTIKGDFKI